MNKKEIVTLFQIILFIWINWKNPQQLIKATMLEHAMSQSWKQGWQKATWFSALSAINFFF